MPIGAPARDAVTDIRSHPFDKLYFAYLLFAPIGATALATATYDGPKDFALALLWLGGAVAIAIYASFVGTYLVAPSAWWRKLLAIVDGPLWIAIAALTLHGWDVLHLSAWFFVAESLGVYLAIAIVAVNRAGSRAPAAIGLMVASMAVVCFANGWALVPELARDHAGAAMFAASIAQSTAASYWIVHRDKVVRDANTVMVPVLASLGLMQVAIGAGVLVRFVLLV